VASKKTIFTYAIFFLYFGFYLFFLFSENLFVKNLFKKLLKNQFLNFFGIRNKIIFCILSLIATLFVMDLIFRIVKKVSNSAKAKSYISKTKINDLTTEENENILIQCGLLSGAKKKKSK